MKRDKKEVDERRRTVKEALLSRSL